MALRGPSPHRVMAPPPSAVLSEMLPWLPPLLMCLAQWPGLALKGPLPYQVVPQSEACLSEKHSWRRRLLLLSCSLALRPGSLASSA